MGKMEKEFRIKTYTKKELALMYFPESLPQQAVKHLMSWVKKCKPLWLLLQESGYRPSSKSFTPRQVKDIAEHLGEP